NTAALLHGSPGGMIDGVPELTDSGMSSSPFGLDLFALGQTKHARGELFDGLFATLIPAREIASFSKSSLAGVPRDTALGLLQHPSSKNAVGLVARIARCVVSAIGFKFPFFAGNPSQHTTFDCPEVCAD